MNLLRQEYYQYLLSSRQEEIAGDLKAREGDLNSALQLYLRGGYPVKAASLVLNEPGLSDNSEVVERVTSALLQAKCYEKCGEFCEQLHSYDKALECYRKAHAYFKAVELARREKRSEVVTLEERTFRVFCVFDVRFCSFGAPLSLILLCAASIPQPQSGVIGW